MHLQIMTNIIENPKKNFISEIIEKDFLKQNNNKSIVTRFPPEPNGYLHIGHAKAICLNFEIAKHYSGTCNLRFDDTNPANEELDYINAIVESIQWLGFDWKNCLYYASDYFDKCFEFAILLIKKGKAYVCDLSTDQIREYRGTLKNIGIESPFRNRSIDENLHLFQLMKDGKFIDGSRVLRAKIDMYSPNMNMRDPVMYRIKHCQHIRTGNKWCIYPMYDYAHCISDALEGITHSLCTLEFEDHRPLYEWFLNQIGIFSNHPRQIEFSRLNLTYTLTSKRKLSELVEKKIVNGWDDPRMPTIIGMRRRGIPASAIRNFCEKIGITKQDSIVDIKYFEECIRDDLNLTSQRVMGILNPLKLVITNFDEDVDYLNAAYHPNNDSMGSRMVPFARDIYIERDDFMEFPSKDFFRLSLGKEVRLRYAYIIKCIKVIKDLNTGEIIELHCTYDPKTRGGITNGHKVRGTIHWVAVNYAISAEVRLYDYLLNMPYVKFGDFSEINLNSLVRLTNCFVEQSLFNAKSEQKFQFERIGYFCVDYNHSSTKKLMFHRTISLKDGRGRMQ